MKIKLTILFSLCTIILFAKKESYQNYPQIPLNCEFKLNRHLKESSGLIFFNNLIWSHNDDKNNHLYGFSTNKKNIKKKICVLNTATTDWEDITQDNNFIYIGNTGNNTHIQRDTLTIYRINKNLISKKKISKVFCDSIQFYYPGFKLNGKRQHNFDCEAICTFNNQILIFTKEWNSLKTTCYSVPTDPGTYQANPIQSYTINGLVTGADYDAPNNRIILVGYMPRNADMHGGFSIFCTVIKIENNQLTDMSKTYRFSPTDSPLNIIQMEGICIENNRVYLSSERLRFRKIFNIVNTPHRLWSFDLNALE